MRFYEAEDSCLDGLKKDQGEPVAARQVFEKLGSLILRVAMKKRHSRHRGARPRLMMEAGKKGARPDAASLCLRRAPGLSQWPAMGRATGAGQGKFPRKGFQSNIRSFADLQGIGGLPLLAAQVVRLSYKLELISHRGAWRQPAGLSGLLL